MRQLPNVPLPSAQKWCRTASETGGRAEERSMKQKQELCRKRSSIVYQLPTATQPSFPKPSFISKRIRNTPACELVAVIRKSKEAPILYGYRHGVVSGSQCRTVGCMLRNHAAVLKGCRYADEFTSEAFQPESTFAEDVGAGRTASVHKTRLGKLRERPERPTLQRRSLTGMFVSLFVARRR